MITTLVSALYRLAAALLLLAVLTGAAVSAPGGSSGASAILADDDDQADDDEDDENDVDEGDDDSGNEDDGKVEDEDEDEERDDDDRATQPVRLAEEPVTSTEPLRVDVDCDRDSERDRTTCAFVPVGVAGSGLDLLIPVQGVCANVTGGVYETDPLGDEDGGEVAYYSARSGEIEVVLVLAGEVSPTGSTIYWVETDADRQPAVGLGLMCASQSDSTPEPSPTPEATVATGSITVQAYRCDVAEPADPTAFDWYGECATPGDGLTFDLFRADNATLVETLRANDDGVATFATLNAETYRLEESGGDWCHAESDSVDASGDVVVEAGTAATVWIFQCAEGEAVK